jgi:hypothetical protein
MASCLVKAQGQLQLFFKFGYSLLKCSCRLSASNPKQSHEDGSSANSRNVVYIKIPETLGNVKLDISEMN